MANGIRTVDPCEFNKGRSSKFCDGFWVQQTPEVSWRTYWPKHGGNNNKGEDNSPKTLNDNNTNKKFFYFFTFLQATSIKLGAKSSTMCHFFFLSYSNIHIKTGSLHCNEFIFRFFSISPLLWRVLIIFIILKINTVFKEVQVSVNIFHFFALGLDSKLLTPRLDPFKCYYSESVDLGAMAMTSDCLMSPLLWRFLIIFITLKMNTVSMRYKWL